MVKRPVISLDCPIQSLLTTDVDFLSRGRFGSHLLGLLVCCSYNVLWVSCPLERVMGSGSQELNLVRLTIS